MAQNAEQNVAAQAEKKDEKKELPQLKSPMTRLSDGIRKPIAKYVKEELGSSFSRETLKMWAERMKKESKISDPVYDEAITMANSKGGGGGGVSYKKQYEEARSQLNEMRKELDKLKSQKKN